MVNFKILPCVLLILCGGQQQQGDAVSVQDSYVLGRVYTQLAGYNPGLKKSTPLERLAQRHSCVKHHSDHRSTDQAALQLYNNYQANIACIGGCDEGSSNWSRNNPAGIWKEFQGRTNHYNNIISADVYGCSAAKRGNTICVFCYFANTN
eukprot:GFUD01049948.1.p1 GENE.GFUD01049948.1~~GFUD01049948.1.p1  ORF type:complete len:150 (+),score=18.71 GFUD01049948.1:61-510(+)